MLEPRKSGAPVAVALGCMNFGKRTPAAEAERIVLRALERGVTFFDTANAYVEGESERILGRALRGRRDACTVATKVGAARPGGKPEGLSRAVILEAIDGSLGRLGMDHVDVYYLHVPDHAVPVEESLAAMEDLRHAGKIRALGVSNYAAWQILDMMTLAGAGRAPQPAIVQVMYNLLIRQIEVEYVAFARRHPLHTTVYNPLAGGLLTGKHARGGDAEKGSRFDKNRLYQGRYWSDRFFDLVDAYGAVARDAGLEPGRSLLRLARRPPARRLHPGRAGLDRAPRRRARRLREDALAGGAARASTRIHRAYLGTDASYVR